MKADGVQLFSGPPFDVVQRASEVIGSEHSALVVLAHLPERTPHAEEAGDELKLVDAISGHPVHRPNVLARLQIEEVFLFGFAPVHRTPHALIAVAVEVLPAVEELKRRISTKILNNTTVSALTERGGSPPPSFWLLNVPEG